MLVCLTAKDDAEPAEQLGNTPIYVDGMTRNCEDQAQSVGTQSYVIRFWQYDRYMH